MGNKLVDTDQKRVRSIFLAAVEDHAPEQWVEFLGNACEREPELRRRVEVLLRGHERPNDLLDKPGDAPVPPAPPSIGEGPGTLIGPYKLLEQIGEGGFGVVFMAEQQQPVRRKVALKIVKPGMDTRQVVARFEAERQALALMDHPNIAQIFDGGATASGRPYFVMELVRGITITDFCDQHHLGVRERLELFTHVCQAVQHAHQKGIIHRDLKPSNVMVTQHDVTPVVKIIDFGIAKATGQQLTEKTLFTNFAQMIGTPMYMSPEQAQMSGLDVDTRSDVYSLGVLLYELMTGTTPFDKERLRTTPYEEIIRIICEEEPVRPSTRISTLGNAANTAPIDRNITPQKLSQLLRGELDWIVMKALEKDRNRRYESAGALANEVRRYLQDEPVLACPPTVGYRLRKLARQHKAALVTATIVFAALSAGTAVAVWQAVVATQAKQDALDSAAAEKNAKIVAEAKEAEARAVLTFLESRVIGVARPEGDFGGLGYDVSLRRAIEAAVPFVQEGFKDQPLIEARLRMTLGHSFAALGEPKKSGDQYAIAREIYIRLLGPDDQFTLQSMLGSATSLNALGRYVDASRLCETTFAQMHVTLGLDHEDTLRAMDKLGDCYVDMGKNDAALPWRDRALEIRKAKLGPEHLHTLMTFTRLANTYLNLGRYQEALAIHQNVLATEDAAFGRDHPATLDSINNLAVTYDFLGRHLDAFKLRKELLERRTNKMGFDHPYTLLAKRHLATSFHMLGQHDDGFKHNEASLALSKERLGREHPDTLQCMSQFANSHYYLRKFTVALAMHDETMRLRATHLGPDHPDTLYSRANLASCHNALGQHEAALKLELETLALREVKLGNDHPCTLETMNSLGTTYRALGQHGKALAVHQETLAKRGKKLGATHPDTLRSLTRVAQSLAELGRGAEALPLIDDGVQRLMMVDVNYVIVGELMALRKNHFLQQRDLAGCRSTAAMWVALGRTDASSLYVTGRSFALVASLIREQDHSAEAAQRADAEADQAMDWLRKAVAAGYKNAAHMAKDADLDVLRQRPDFIKLMAEVAELPTPKDR